MRNKTGFFRVLAAFSAATAMTLTLAACSDDSGDAMDKPLASVETPAPADTAVNTVDPITTAAVDVPQSLGNVDMDKVLEPGPMPEMAIGDEDAPVTIVEYMSMTCPHCAHFHNETFGPIKEKYVDTGKVRFILREFPFDPRAAAAIMLARCAPENQFFPMVSVLFKQQQVWYRAPDGRDALLRMARLAGFTQESFEACLTNQKLLDDVNEVRRKAAEEFGVSATPTFLINGKRYSGSMTVEQMSALIDSML